MSCLLISSSQYLTSASYSCTVNALFHSPASILFLAYASLCAFILVRIIFWNLFSFLCWWCCILLWKKNMQFISLFLLFCLIFFYKGVAICKKIFLLRILLVVGIAKFKLLACHHSTRKYYHPSYEYDKFQRRWKPCSTRATAATRATSFASRNHRLNVLPLFSKD